LRADPLFPPYSIPVLCSAISKQTSVFRYFLISKDIKIQFLSFLLFQFRTRAFFSKSGGSRYFHFGGIPFALNLMLSFENSDHLHQFLPTTNNTDQPRGHFDWKITLIWKNVGRNPVLMLSPLNNQVSKTTSHALSSYFKKLYSGNSWRM